MERLQSFRRNNEEKFKFMRKKISIIIPVYNEEKTLEEIFSKVKSLSFRDFDQEIIIVNDCSTDSSTNILGKLHQKNPSLLVINHQTNKGKSQSVKTGMLRATGEVVVVQDADLEYNPEDLIKMLDLMIEKNADVVYGNRFGKKNRVIYWKNYWGNRFLSLLSNIFTYPKIKVMIPDMEVCYKMISQDVIKNIVRDITSTSNFGIEPEITAMLSKCRRDNKPLKFEIFPVDYFPRTIKEGKKMKAFSDGFKAIKEILKYNLSKRTVDI